MEKLEIETEEERQQRIQSVLEKLNENSKVTPTSSCPDFHLNRTGPLPIYPPSDLLARVQAFLPQIEAANAALDTQVAQDPGSVDIEHLGPEEKQYIQMDLGLGVFEQRQAPRQSTNDDKSSATSDPASEDDDDERDHEDVDSEDNSDSDSDSSASGSSHTPSADSQYDSDSSSDGRSSTDSIISRSRSRSRSFSASSTSSSHSASPSASEILPRIIKPLPKRWRTRPVNENLMDDGVISTMARPEIIVLASSTNNKPTSENEDMEAEGT